MPTKTAKKIERFFDVVKPLHNKNLGGCLLFCYAFWLWLQKNDLPTDTFEIIQYADFPTDLQHNKRWVSDSDIQQIDEPVSSFHFSWKYDGVEYNGEGEGDGLPYTIRGSKLLDGKSHSDLIEDFAERSLIHGDWNWSFDRNEAITLMNRRLRIKIPRYLRV